MQGRRYLGQDRLERSKLAAANTTARIVSFLIANPFMAPLVGNVPATSSLAPTASAS
jgi:hypothetical protein